ncbi:MAG: hypothetical protein KF805_16495 [Phycisphaeraceae bacterium]|nr:hypothetical protein [Phycisphaeraceae bacterium]
MSMSLGSLAFRLSLVGVLAGIAGGCAHSRAPDASLAEQIIQEPHGGQHALQLLKEGNERFLAGQAESPATDPETIRIAAVDGQKPFVSVLTCADSRVPVERVFDRGFGEIFVIRVAGNVTAQHETGSVEFSLAALKAPLLVVMGHTKCGAVKAAIAGQNVTPNIDSFLASIQPAVQKVRAAQPNLSPEQFEEAVTQENVRQTLRELYATSPLIREKVSSGAVEVALAEIDISTGKVTWLDNVPKP